MARRSQRFLKEHFSLNMRILLLSLLFTMYNGNRNCLLVKRNNKLNKSIKVAKAIVIMHIKVADRLYNRAYKLII